jgi:hypothetical protein
MTPGGTARTAASYDPADPRTSEAGADDRACCCPGRPAVLVIMPATRARPHETELLLCGHHYRISRHALAQVHAAVHELPWMTDGTTAWFGRVQGHTSGT